MNHVKIMELLDSTKTNFLVEKVQYPAPLGYGQPSSYGLYPSNDRGGKPLATVGDRYHVLQNKELATAFLQACDQVGLGDAKMRGGTWARGKYIFYQVSLPQTVVGSDTLSRHLTALNSHGDGSCAIGMTNKVQSCANQFHRTIKGMGKIRHTASILTLVREQAKQLNEALLEEQEIIRILREAEATPIRREDTYPLIASLMGVKVDDTAKIDYALSKGLVGGVELDDVSSRKRNMVAEVQNAVNYEMGANRKGSNLFGLFNGVTYYTNHKMTKAEKTQASLMVGKGYKFNNQALSFVEGALV